jgi:hypothetical protein
VLQLDGLEQPGDQPEELEASETHDIGSKVILPGIAQPDPAENPRTRDNKHLQRALIGEVTNSLLPVEFCP